MVHVNLRLCTWTALIVLAACGTRAGSVLSARATDATITFGAALSLSGREAREGRLTQEGYDFWRDYVNAHGGLNVAGTRYAIVITYDDDGSNPQSTPRLIEKLVDADHANFILGPYGSSSTFSAAAVAERMKIPMVAAEGGAERTFDQGYHYTFGVLSPARRYLQGVIDVALHERPRPRTMAIIAADDTFSQEAAQGAIAYALAHGIKVVYSASYSTQTTDVSGIVSAVKASKPDIILNAGHLEDSLLVQRALKAQNVLAEAYGNTVGADTPDFRESLGRAADFVFSGAQWSSSVRYRGAPGFYASSSEYSAAFSKHYGHAPDYHNADASAAGLAFQYAIEKAGSIDPAKVREALKHLDVTTFYGVITFDSRGLNVDKPMVVNQIQDGSLVTVWPASVAVAKPQYPAPDWALR